MDWRNDRIKACQNGTNPMLMKELSGGFAVLAIPNFYQATVCCYLKNQSEA